jgi:hypothetical protein
MGPSLILPSLLSVVLLHVAPPATGMPESIGAVAVPPKQPDKGAPPDPPDPPEPPAPPTPPAPIAAPCKLLTPEAPRGGRLEVEGDGFGKTPVVRIGGRVARTLERAPQRLAVQIATDSNGGPVTVTADGKTMQCGVLLIIGRD